MVDDPMPPTPGSAVAAWHGLTVHAAGEAAVVSDGASVMHLWLKEAQGEAQLAPTFVHEPRLRRQRFWALGLMKLLRSQGLFALHAAGVSTPCGTNVLLIGASGAGKSTLAFGVVPHGWGYLSDDAVLLRARPDRVEAVTLRRTFLVSVADGKRPVDVQSTHPGQHLGPVSPSLLFFPRIVSREDSTTRRLSVAEAVARLLSHSGPELFDRDTMGLHLRALAELARQAPAYELSAGRDLYDRPDRLLKIIADCDGTTQWPVSSLS
jgi:hypothetical protein